MSVKLSELMAKAKKRRVANRTSKKQGASRAGKRGAQGAKEVLRARAWVRDAFSVLVIGVGIFILLGIGSHLQQLLFGEVPGARGNLMGFTGHVIATVLFGVLGVSAFLPMIGIVWFAFYRIGGEAGDEGIYPKPVVFLAGISFIVSVASLSAMVLSSSYAGDLGCLVTDLLRRGLGRGGAVVALVFVCLVSMALVSQTSIGDLSRALQSLGRWFMHVCFVRVPVVTARVSLIALGFFWSMCHRGMVNLGRLFVLKDIPQENADSDDRGFSIDEEQLSEELPQSREFTISDDDSDTDEGEEDEEDFDDDEEEDYYDDDEPEPERFEPIIVKPKPRVTKGASVLRSRSEVEASPSLLPQFESYRAPELDLLTPETEQEVGDDDNELRQKAEQIETKLKDFNIAGRVTQVHPGPVITLFEFEPAPGVKVGRIAALQDDLAMSLRASSIRIIAPLPKRGTVGIEVPNKSRAMVRLRDCLESQSFASADSILSVPLGKDTYGDAVVVDVATMPHLLMAGATGTGKSVCINTLLLSLLYRAHPSELGLILIDPKVLELSIYDGVPHLRVPVVTDPRQAKGVLLWAVKEMDRRYRYMQKFGVRNIDGYNRIVSGADEDTDGLMRAPDAANQIQMFKDAEDQAVADEAGGETQESEEGKVAPEVLQPMPKLVIVIDELADLMLSVGREIEELITRLAQKARAAGIHLIVATQRPSVDVITGLIKANFPARLSFRVSSRIDSRTILDSMGAEKLLGKGDMLFMLPGAVPLKRVHGAYVSDNEVQKVVASLKSDCAPQYDEAILEACEKALKEGSEDSSGSSRGEAAEDEFDPYYDRAVELVVEKGQASTSMIQRTFRIGYNRAARIIEMMEREGVVGKMDGVRPREVLAPAARASEV